MERIEHVVLGQRLARFEHMPQDGRFELAPPFLAHEMRLPNGLPHEIDIDPGQFRMAREQRSPHIGFDRGAVGVVLRAKRHLDRGAVMVEFDPVNQAEIDEVDVRIRVEDPGEGIE